MMSSYTIKAVAERTGLSPHVIRAWERRYGAIDPERSPGKHRLYSDADIERLDLLNRAIGNGHNIGKIARLPNHALLPLGDGHESSKNDRKIGMLNVTVAAFQSGVLKSVSRFDEPELEQELRRALLALGHQGLLQRVIAPLAREIGNRWRSGELTVAHEHFFTASAKVFLGELSRQFATPLTAPRIIVATPVGQLHELGAVMATATAANLGWRPIYLGPSLPAGEIAGAALRNEVAAVALSIIYPDDDPNVTGQLAELENLLPANIRIFIGGRAARSFLESSNRGSTHYVYSLEEFGIELDALRASRSESSANRSSMVPGKSQSSRPHIPKSRRSPRI